MCKQFEGDIFLLKKSTEFRDNYMLNLSLPASLSQLSFRIKSRLNDIVENCY